MEVLEARFKYEYERHGFRYELQIQSSTQNAGADLQARYVN